MYKANSVIDKLPEFKKQFIVKGEPVIDHQNSITITQKNNENETVEACVEKIKNYEQNGFKSIAIIGKDIEECKLIKKKMDPYHLNLKLIQYLSQLFLQL